MKLRYIILTLLCQITLSTFAIDFGENTSVALRIGANLGGTMPLDMPGSIRGLNSYSVQFNPHVSMTANMPISSRLSVESGLRIERKAMRTDANVKGYHMKMVQGSDVIEGVFTGGVVTKCVTWGLAVPAQLAYNFGADVKLRVGPVLSAMFYKDFAGHAYDGYLRKGTPIGERVEIGTTQEQRGEYNFGKEMRTFQFAMDVGVDWSITSGYGVFADVQCGLNGAFKTSFKTIEQTMYPIYCTVGVIKRIR